MNFGRKLTSSLGCAVGEVECWTQCMSTAGLKCGNVLDPSQYDSSNVVCYDSGGTTSGGVEVPAGPCDGGQMCPSSGMMNPSKINYYSYLNHIFFNFLKLIH
jgi:hypothetical protein